MTNGKGSIQLLLALIMGAFSLSAHSVPGCIDANVISGKLITDICWSCVYPIRLSGHTITGGNRRYPTEAVNSSVCTCADDLGVQHPGIPTSMWEPARIIEFQRVPGCSSVLNGIRFPFELTFQGHHRAGQKSGPEGTFLHYHMYAFPLMTMLDIFVNRTCSADGYVDLDIMYLSEVDPTWNNDELAFFTNPEAAAVANPVAVTACTADAVSSTAGYPLSQLFWCAGSWGTVYPLSGSQYTNSSIVDNTSLLTVKALTAIHRRGLAYKTMGENAMCEGQISVTFPKAQYKYTLLHPIPEANSDHVTGESSITWGMAKTIPAIGEDLVSIIWRWNDCCNTTQN